MAHNCNAATLNGRNTMRIDVRFLGIRRSKALADHARRRAIAHLARPEFDLASVTVRLDDTNGPKGGVCKACHVVARGPSLGEVSVKAVDDSIYAAIGQAIHRVQRSLSRRAKRLRDRSRATAAPEALVHVLSVSESQTDMPVFTE